MMRICFVLTFLLLTLFVQAQEIIGKWYAYPDLRNMRLRFEYDVQKENGAYTVKLFLPDVSSKIYTANKVSFAGKTLSVVVDDAQTSCTVQWQDDATLKGVLIWEGYEFPVHLTHTPKIFNRPQTPKAPFPYHTEDVSFINTDDNTSLAGTLTLPQGSDKSMAVVLISGSGGQDRDNTFSEHKTFLVMADYFARHGIATLRVDDRGIGKSEGDARNSALPDATSDAMAAVNYLKQRPEVSADKIGVIGHSEGAFAAFSLAAYKEVSFIITMAGGGVKGSDLLLMQRAALLKASGAEDDFISKYNESMAKAQEIVLQTGDAMTCERKLAELFIGTSLAGQAANITRQLFNPAKIELLKYDPQWDFAEITCPVLALNGDKDCQVPVCNLEYIKKGITANGNMQVKTIVFPGLNHMFQTADSGAPVEYSDIEETISPSVLEEMVNWMKQLKQVFCQ